MCFPWIEVCNSLKLNNWPTAVPDTAVPDTAVPDTAVPDTAVPDTAVPNTAVPDTAVPDSAVPDTAVPDTAVPDSAESPMQIRQIHLLVNKETIYAQQSRNTEKDKIKILIYKTSIQINRESRLSK